MNFHIITLFPNSFDSYIGESIIKRAVEDQEDQDQVLQPKRLCR
jgi:tRNA G37 N-methylase TrmD